MGLPNSRSSSSNIPAEEETAIKKFIVVNQVIPRVLFMSENFRDIVAWIFLEKNSGPGTSISLLNISL
jgi:hypothetical protein